jgi:hypothetical protein
MRRIIFCLVAGLLGLRSEARQGRIVVDASGHGDLEYSWYADNLTSAPGAPVAGEINAKWVFGTKWNPL